MKVGVVGLGIMGSAMAANLAKARFTVQGYDVVRKRGAVRSLGDIDAPVVISSLPSSDALFSTVRALGGKGRIVVETSTLPLEDKLEALTLLKAKGVILLDCPLSGTGAQAKTKDLVVLASGERKAFNKVVPVLKGFARSHYYLGEFGNGTKMKLVANLLVAIHNVSAAEAFVLGMKAGLDPKTIYKVIADGAGSSRMFQVRGPQMVAGRYEPATMKNEVWQKDMKIIGEFAARLGARTPLFDAAGPVYAAAMAQGFAKADTAAVCAVLEALSGLRR
ncbi:MAG TPA: NAD(P)-dependent oxidoreductase [Burkholderiales bacterium]|nr:NAD(P)-dependent oxidoreductase [Burkholderiales bacterium]